MCGEECKKNISKVVQIEAAMMAGTRNWRRRLSWIRTKGRSWSTSWKRRGRSCMRTREREAGGDGGDAESA